MWTGFFGVSSAKEPRTLEWSCFRALPRSYHGNRSRAFFSVRRSARRHGASSVDRAVTSRRSTGARSGPIPSSGCPRTNSRPSTTVSSLRVGPALRSWPFTLIGMRSRHHGSDSCYTGSLSVRSRIAVPRLTGTTFAGRSNP